MASILITGTSKGIGLSTAVTLGRAGHKVFATMRNPSRAPELGEIVARESLPVTILAMDVDSDESVKTTIANVQKENGPLDVLVNNAGIERDGSIEETPIADFRAVMETNYFGILRCVQAVAPEMRKRKAGCIINVTSVAGKIANSPMSPYVASKWAAEALSEILAQEMKPFNVRVAIVEPGIIETEMATAISKAVPPSVYRQPERFAALFAAALKNPVSPAVVAEKILDIIVSGTWQLRHPVGPDAVPFIEWRNGMNDEEWVSMNASDDETWYRRIEKDFGLDSRPEKLKKAV
jgi:NAD(P)-dependent dehydrogenase (short-subunit alcohol dehydrogenase family)